MVLAEILIVRFSVASGRSWLRQQAGHSGQLGQVAVTLGVGERQELLKLLIGLEGVRSQVVERADRPSFLGREQLSYRPPWPSR